MKNISYLFILLSLFIFVVYTILNIKYIKTIRDISSKKKELVKNTYPNLDNDELRERRKNIILYQKQNLDSGNQSTLRLLAGLAIVVALVVLIISLFLLWTPIISISMSVILFLLAFLFDIKANLDNQFYFWHNYLEKHPENKLNICLIDKESAQQLSFASSKLKTYFFFSGLIFLACSLFYLMHTVIN